MYNASVLKSSTVPIRKKEYIMKKILISFILVLCLTAALACGLTVSAFADGDTVEGYWIPYTVENGDTLYNICAAKGVDYNAQGSLICSFSGIGDVKNLRAGMTVWLPVSDKGSSDTYYTVYGHDVVAGDTWYNLCLSYKTGYNACSAKIALLNGSTNLNVGAKVKLPVLTQAAPAPSGSASSSATAAFPTSPAAKPAASAAPAAAKKEEAKPVDTSYMYLVPVTLEAGDTVGAICKDLGSDFSVFSEKISSINGIASYNNLRVGQKLYIPTNATPPSADYYVIVEHSVVAGDSLKDICKDLKVDLNESLSLIKAVNPGLTNPGMIYVGQKLLIPTASGNAPAPSSAAPAASASAPAAVKSSSNEVSSIMIFSPEHGNVLSKVNGAHRTAASEGTKVNLDITPEAGWKVDTITVSTFDTHKSVTVTGTSFIMPACAVEVSVTFERAR